MHCGHKYGRKLELLIFLSDTFHMEFGKLLKKLREKEGISQRELAKELGVGKTTVSVWESGLTEPNMTSLKKLSEFFNISIDELCGK